MKTNATSKPGKAEARIEFPAAQDRACRLGWELKAFNDGKHYLLRGIGWILNLYPGTGRVHAIPTEARPHFPERWTLMEVLDICEKTSPSDLMFKPADLIQMTTAMLTGDIEPLDATISPSTETWKATLAKTKEAARWKSARASQAKRDFPRLFKRAWGFNAQLESIHKGIHYKLKFRKLALSIELFPVDQIVRITPKAMPAPTLPSPWNLKDVIEYYERHPFPSHRPLQQAAFPPPQR